MLYREIIAVCSEIRTKHINTVCGQNVVLLNVKLCSEIRTKHINTVCGQDVELLNVKIVVYIVTTGL